jgi:KUP system potassium uptake protein
MSHPKIKIEDGVEQIGPGSAVDEHSAWQRPDIGPSTGVAGGIYYGRLSRSANDRRSLSRSRANESKADAEAGDDWRRDDGRKKQVFKGRTLLWSVSIPIIVLPGSLTPALQAGIPVYWCYLRRHWN